MDLSIEENVLEADVIFACGPMPMLRAIKNYAEANGIECYISLEEKMERYEKLSITSLTPTNELDN